MKFKTCGCGCGTSSSSWIKAVKWSNGLLVLTTLTGQIYVYSGVTEEVYEEMINSESLGEFFSKNIRGRYVYVRATD